ncbi:hypothetical protein [Actinomadura rupiterrae]|uniref:hypothetical protein n=1 Tax=Actinomadura rupiterrae TaxID=559627 RepID=UPI0020A47CE2|nr:hypothetical protein [Actinomadura rupiterrae]MCP2339198.1 hypothetical protein [Actinomadura rupiterrae]
MTEPSRAQVMKPGHCSFCGGPGERGPSGAWWHTGESCHTGYGVLPAGAVPRGPLGGPGEWPPRFVPEEP